MPLKPSGKPVQNPFAAKKPTPFGKAARKPAAAKPKPIKKKKPDFGVHGFAKHVVKFSSAESLVQRAKARAEKNPNLAAFYYLRAVQKGIKGPLQYLEKSGDLFLKEGNLFGAKQVIIALKAKKRESRSGYYDSAIEAFEVAIKKAEAS